MKKIYRSQENKIVFGIFGGIGEYFDIDPAIFRLVGLALCFATGIFPFILIYILAYFVIPNKEKETSQVKRLYRSKDNYIFCGMCGGLGEYFNIDPTIIRLFAILLCILTAIIPFIILYTVSCFVIPTKDGEIKPFPRKKIILIIFLLLLIMLVSGLIYGLEF